MKRLLVVFSILSVLLVAAIVAPSFVDWNKYKVQIVQQAQKATGYEIEIAGDLSMAVLPFPHLSIAGLTVDNPEARKQKPLAKAENVSVQVALFPLFGGDIEVSQVSLQSPEINLVVDNAGAANWKTSRMEEKSKGGSTQNQLGETIALNSINIKNGSLSYVDHSNNTKHAVSDLNVGLSGEGVMGPYDAEGSLVYNGQKIVFEHENGHIGKLKDSLPVDVTLKWPDLGTEASFSGVVAQRDNLEAQGNIDFKADKLAAFAKEYGINVAGHLDRKTAVKGFVTLQGSDLNLRDAVISHGNNKVSGYALLSNYKPGSSTPLNVDMNFESDSAVNLDALRPAKPAAKKSSGFLPETITLPQNVTGNINFKAPAVVLNGQTFKGVELVIATKSGAYEIQSSISAPGQTSVIFTGAMNFGAKSKSSSGNTLTMSEPVVKGNVKITSEEPDQLISALSKNSVPDNMKRILAYSLGSEVDMVVTPQKVGASAGYVKLDDTRVNFSGSYKKGEGGARDVANIVAKSATLDVDKWLQRMSEKSAAIAAQTEVADIKEIAAGIKVPFDAVYNLDIQGLRFKGRDYLSFTADGALTGDDLRVESATLKSNSNDNFVLKGSVKDLSKIGGVDMTLKASINDVEQTLASFNIKDITLPTRVGQADIISEFKGTPQKLAFTTNVNALRASTQASGILSDALAAPKVSDLTLRFKHPNFVDLIRMFKPDFSSGVALKKGVDVFASMKRDGDVYSFSELQASLGPTTVTGDLSVTMGGKPYAKAALDFTELPLDALMGVSKGGRKNDMRQKPGGNQDVRWSRNAIDTTWMHKADFDVKATAKSFSYGAWNFLNAGANVSLKDGTLQVKQLDGAFAGGQVALTGSAKSSPQPRQPLSITGDFIAQNVSLEQFVQSFSGGNKLVKASGDVSVNGKVFSSGLSPAALVFDLNGDATAAGSNIVFEGFDLARLSRALSESSSSFTQNFSSLLSASMGGGATKFETLDGKFTIKEGVVNFDRMLLTGIDADVDTTGNVNLPLWTVDLVSSVQLKEPEDAPPLKAAFKGSLNNPGRTFGQSALNQYFQKQLEGLVVSPVLDKIDGGETIKKFLGVGGSGPSVGTGEKQEPEKQMQDGAAATEGEDLQENTAPQQQQQESRPVTKEEAIFGVIEGLIGGQ